MNERITACSSGAIHEKTWGMHTKKVGMREKWGAGGLGGRIRKKRKPSTTNPTYAGKRGRKGIPLKKKIGCCKLRSLLDWITSEKGRKGGPQRS